MVTPYSRAFNAQPIPQLLSALESAAKVTSFLTIRARDLSDTRERVVYFSATRSHGSHHYTGCFGIVPGADNETSQHAADDFRRACRSDASERIILSLDWETERI